MWKSGRSGKQFSIRAKLSLLPLMRTGKILATMSKDPNEIARFLSRRRYERDREHERAVLRDEGLAEGLTKGRAEVARNFLADGESIDRVMRLTGLSKTELVLCNT
jgi:hypothetical protein